jgi:lipopolysaccharide/colanic/teichoic acid biosynthesis glycosyltransferase
MKFPSKTIAFFDFIIVLLSFVGVYFLRYGLYKNVFTLPILIYSVIIIFSFFVFRMYEPFRNFKFRELFLFTLFSLAVSTAIISLFIIYLLNLDFARFVFFTTVIFLNFIIPSFHFFITKILKKASPPIKIYLFGSKNKDLAIETVNDANHIFNYINTSNVKDADIILVTDYNLNNDEYSLLREYENLGKRILFLDSFYEDIYQRVPIEVIPKDYFWRLSSYQTVEYQPDILIRIIDIITSLIAIILLSPLFLIIPIIIKLDSRGEIIYRQERIGKNFKPFTLFKYRSMKKDAERFTGAVWAKENDTRITRAGKFLRKTRLDEIPQFFNVLKGDMSIVGPRPERLKFINELSEKIPFYTERLRVKPGITGWAQVMHKYDEDLKSVEIKVGYDLYYVKNYSITFYFKVIFYTIETMIFGKGAK